MSKLLAVLISVAIVAASFTSAAEAGPGRRLGFFLGGMAAASMLAHAAEERRREEAYERERARRQMIAARERQRAAAAAAAKRERARQFALQQQKAAQLAAADTTPPATSDTDKPALKKGDRLPSAQAAPTSPAGASQTTTIEKSASDGSNITTGAIGDATPTPVTCRKYSAATDSVIETPCK